MNTIQVERAFPTGQTIQIVQGDITIEEVDAILGDLRKLTEGGIQGVGAGG